jgi:hypothetical protein
MIKGDLNEFNNAISEQPWVWKRKVDFTVAGQRAQFTWQYVLIGAHGNCDNPPDAHT